MEDVGRLRMMEDGRMIAKKSISCMRVLCIYRMLLAAQKRIRTAILSTDHSLFTLGSNRRESSLKEHELYHEKGDLGVGQVFEIHALRVMISKPSLLEISI